MLVVTRQLFEEAIDRLIDLRDQIEALQVQETELEDLIKDGGEGRHTGTILDALVYKQERHYVHWKALAEYMKVPKRIIKKFTEPQEVLCLKLVSKHKKVA